MTCPKCGEVRQIEHIRTVVLTAGVRVLEYACAACGHGWKVKP